MKDIKDILHELNLDLSNPEVVKAASEAIMQILTGRMGNDSETLKDRLGKKAQRTNDEDNSELLKDLGEFEQEIDPNLIQPPQKSNGANNEVETEIEDDENVLSRIKQLGNQNDSNQDSNSDDSNGGQQSSTNNSNTSENNTNSTSGNKSDSGSDSDNTEQNSTPNNKSNGSGNNSQDEPDEDTPNDGDATGGGTSDNSVSDEDSEDETASGTWPDETEDKDDEDGEDEDEVEGEDEDGEDADSVFTSKISGKNPKNEAQRIQISRTLKAAQKTQVKAAEAGQNTTATLLDKCQEMLKDLLEELENDPNSEIAEQKLSQVVQKTLDAISEVDKAGLTFKSDDERARQVKQLKDTMSDTATTTELSAEDVEQIRADKQAIINNQKEIDKYAPKSRSSFKGFEDFVTSLRKSLAMQVESEKVKAGSWAAINRRYDGTSVVKPGIKNKMLPNTKVPVIDFYFDCSASWDRYDLEKGGEALSKIAQLEKDGEIKINVFYFADHVYADPSSPRHDSGTRAWNAIIDNIVLTKATNVVIMTDSDMQWQCKNPPHKGYKVSGFVWYLWKDGVNAQNLPQLLQGRCGTMQYAFDS